MVVSAGLLFLFLLGGGSEGSSTPAEPVLLTITNPNVRPVDHPIWSKVKQWMDIKTEESPIPEEEGGGDLEFKQGDRMCVTAMLNPQWKEIEGFTHLPLHLYIYDLRLCSTKSSVGRVEGSGSVPGTLLRPYDTEHHFSTGCFTRGIQSLNQHVVIAHKDAPVSGDDAHLIRLSDSAQALVVKRDEVSLSFDNIAATACFRVHPVGPSDVPVMVQASVVIAMDTNATEVEEPYQAYIEALGLGASKDAPVVEVEENHDALHQCLARPKSVDSVGWTNRDKNHQLKLRHRKKRFKEEPPHPVKEEKCTDRFNQRVPGARVVTVTNEKRADFDYEAMQSAKHYYYGHPYHYDHVHIGCDWKLDFSSGAGICETPSQIKDDGVHLMVLFFVFFGVVFGAIFYYYDLSARAIFKHHAH